MLSRFIHEAYITDIVLNDLIQVFPIITVSQVIIPYKQALYYTYSLLTSRRLTTISAWLLMISPKATASE